MILLTSEAGYFAVFWLRLTLSCFSLLSFLFSSFSDSSRPQIHQPISFSSFLSSISEYSDSPRPQIHQPISFSRMAVPKQNRQPRWSDRETITLLEAVQERRRTILQVGNTNNQNHHKTKAWREVAEAVNASNPEGTKRLPAGCRKRWIDLKKLARDFERRRAQTGGGPPPEQPEYFEAVKDVLGEDYASSHGINDTGAGHVPNNGWGLRLAAPLVEEPVNVPDHPETVNGDHTVITQFCLPADIDPLSHSEGEDQLPDPVQASPHREEQGEPPARRLLDMSFEPTPMATPGQQRRRAHPGSPAEQRLWKEYLAAATALLQAKREALDNQEARARAREARERAREARERDREATERDLFELDLELKRADLALKRAELRHFVPSDAPDHSDFE